MLWLRATSAVVEQKERREEEGGAGSADEKESGCLFYPLKVRSGCLHPRVRREGLVIKVIRLPRLEGMHNVTLAVV